MVPQTAINKSRGLNASTCNQMAEQYVDMLTTELQCSSWGSITHTHHGNIVGKTGDSARVQRAQGKCGARSWPAVSGYISVRVRALQWLFVCLEHANSCKFFSSANVNESAFKDNRTDRTNYRKTQREGCMWEGKLLKMFEVLIPGGVVEWDQRSYEWLTFNVRDRHKTHCLSHQLEFK